MDLATVVALGTAASALLVGLLALWIMLLRARGLERQLVATRDDVAALGKRVEALVPEADPRPVRTELGYVITDLSEPGDAVTWTDVSPLRRSEDSTEQPSEAPAEITTAAFASLALGESLVKAVAFGYGVRRALSPENRNRIAFEMRREVRRSRKQRRRELKQARRQVREDAA
jgi:hypothetical protein